VIANVSVDFEEYGMDEDLLPLLQSKWENKLLATKVADFALRPDNEAAGSSSQPAHPPPAAARPPSNGVEVKAEPDELRLRGGASEDTKPNIALSDVAPQPRPEPNAAGLLPGDEVIDSDLDDSDDELGIDDDDENGEGEIDIVYCVYDKVQRVKNKWKTVFKDGMIHINGKDYLFAKCQGEFEW
jgi:transcription initiation factor TFIIA large subunit